MAWKLCVGFILVGFVAIRCWDRSHNQSLNLLFLDVGQGDSILLELPSGKRILVDGGGGFGKSDIGKRLVVPELARRSILSLDALWLTHPDADHAGGFKGVLEEMKVGELWVQESFMREPVRLLKEIIQLARQNGTQLRLFNKDITELISGVEIRLHWLGDQGPENNRSLVGEISFAGCKILLTGDIEAPAEEKLLNGLPPLDILKVAHHGSKT